MLKVSQLSQSRVLISKHSEQVEGVEVIGITITEKGDAEGSRQLLWPITTTLWRTLSSAFLQHHFVLSMFALPRARSRKISLDPVEVVPVFEHRDTLEAWKLEAGFTEDHMEGKEIRESVMDQRGMNCKCGTEGSSWGREDINREDRHSHGSR